MYDEKKGENYICEVCGRSFKNDHALATHIGIVHLKKPQDDNGFDLIFIVMALSIIGFFIFNFIKKPIPAEALDKVF